MNKLAAINSAIEEVNKQALFGSVVNFARRGINSIKGVKAPPVVSAGGAAASAQKSGIIRNVAATGAVIAAPMVFRGSTISSGGLPG